MGKSKKKAAKHSKEVSSIVTISKSDENQYCIPMPEFDEDNYWIWESRMKVHLEAHDVW